MEVKPKNPASCKGLSAAHLRSKEPEGYEQAFKAIILINKSDNFCHTIDQGKSQAQKRIQPKITSTPGC